MSDSEDPITRFATERAAAQEEMAKDEELGALSRRWMLASAEHGYTYNFRWMGRPVIQFPQDLIAMQELIWEVRPDVIVETGVAHGGSAVFYASILQLAGGGRVLGVDIDIRAHNRAAIEDHVMAPYIELFEGSSVDPELVERVKAQIEPHERVLVVLDSNHTHDHVLEELRAWSSLVGKGSYVVVMDTGIDIAPPELFKDRPWGPGNSPASAVHAFLEETNRFELDVDRGGKLLITVAAEGWLRCVRDSA